MKNFYYPLFSLIIVSVLHFSAFSQSISSQTFTVGGDLNKYYPVVFSESNWYDGATEFEVSRSDVHTNSSWRGSLIAKFRVHTTRWGHGSNFIEADIKSNGTSFIADWCDASGANSSADVIVWLKGGGTSYYFRSINSGMALPVVYLNGFQEQNGPLRTYKTEINPAINTNGVNFSRDSRVFGNEVVLGNVGIGVYNPQNKLDVNGVVHAKEVKVDLTGWSDFVFARDYKLKPLSQVKNYIDIHRHLEGIPSAIEVETHGVNMGEMQAKLLQKIEELTLYLIEKDKQVQDQHKKLEAQAAINVELTKRITELEQKLQ